MDGIVDFLNITYNNVLPKRGKVLISQPFMQDGIFKRSVVLLTEYSSEGAVGFILNKPLAVTVADLMDDFPSGESKLSIGGPVNTDNLHYLHTLANIPDAIEIVNGIYWGGQIDVVRKLLTLSIIHPSDIRFFLGYSGWSSGQLENELKQHSWLVGDIPASQIIHPTGKLWEQLVQNMGDKYKMWTTFPENPVLN